MLSDAAVKEFQRLYKEEYGVEISDAEALPLAINLLTFYNNIYRPVKKSWLTDLPDQPPQH